MNFIRNTWAHLRSSLWFLPTVVVLGSVLAALLLIETEGWVVNDLAGRWPRMFGAGADGSREMLSSIATSMITVAGVVFSVTIVALSLTSTQYSPRVLRNFMRDRPTQLVLGVFVGIFAYCLVVLRTIRSADEAPFIPSIAVFSGMAYAFGGIAFLIYFIHHVAQSIQASSIVSRIHDDTAAAIDHLYPEELGESAPADFAGRPLTLQCTPIHSPASGYVTRIDSGSVMNYAMRSGRVLQLEPAIGDFVVKGGVLMRLCGSQAVSDEDRALLRQWVTLGKQRTVEQDAAFGLQQLVDVAVKALSPGINDPTTACMCIDQLSALMTRIATRRIPTPWRFEKSQLRVIAPAPGFAEFLALAFEPVVHHSGTDLQVLGRVLDALDAIERVTRDPARRRPLAAVVRDVRSQLKQVRPAVRAAGLNRRARAMEASLRGGR